MELIGINRMTRLMETTTYTDSDGVQKWEYVCTPTDGPDRSSMQGFQQEQVVYCWCRMHLPTFRAIERNPNLQRRSAS